MKIQNSLPDLTKYYTVRTGNGLKELKEWIKWAEKNYPNQKLVLVNNYNILMKSKENREYWKNRFNQGLEYKYYVYGSY